MSFTINDLRKISASKEYQDFKNENKKNINLGEKIYGRRKDLQLTQSELSKRSGIPQNKISQLESGTYGNPGLELLQSLSQALEIDESYLIDNRVDRKTFELYNYFLPKIDLEYSGNMQFIKIPYFIDLQVFSVFGRILTNYNYYRYEYGPFDKRMYIYRNIFSGYEKGFKDFNISFLQLEEKNIIDSVINNYPCNDGETLKIMSYDTYPMQNVGATLRGKEHWCLSLDFSQ